MQGLQSLLTRMSDFPLATDQGCALEGGDDPDHNIFKVCTLAFQVCRGGGARAGDHLAEEVPPLVPPLPRLHCHLLRQQAGQAAEVAISRKVQRREPGWDRAQVIICGFEIWFCLDRGCDHDHDYMECNDFTTYYVP